MRDFATYKMAHELNFNELITKMKITSAVAAAIKISNYKSHESCRTRSLPYQSA